MPQAQFASTLSFGRRPDDGFSETISQERHARVARDSMRDLMLFHNALESEIQALQSLADKGQPIDKKLLSLMSGVKEKYDYAMSGLKTLHADLECFALCSLADSIQDLMCYVHNRKKH